MKEIFQNIFTYGGWRGEGTISGPGSTLDATEILRKEMETWPHKYGKVICDIPCGDAHWINSIANKFGKYYGIDIVPEIVEMNKVRHSSLFFEQGNLCDFDFLSKPDINIIFVRDCMVHLSKASIFQALKNICSSSAEFLAITTFIKLREFVDIQEGAWRPINFNLEPFNFPPALEVVIEGCKENQGIYSDKSVGIWKIEDIRKVII